jgi:transposase-like protein
MKHPPFCPNPACVLHYRAPSEVGWCLRSGRYATALHGAVQRYRCRSCGRRFSTQTFSIDYYVKRRVDYHRLLSQLKSTSSCRDMAREFRVSTATVANRTDRLCRSMLAAHLRIACGHRLTEPLVADGFESFTVSQYFPNNIHLLVGKHSQYLYGCNYVTIRRKGRMSAAQRLRREELERANRFGGSSLEHAFARLLHDCADLFRHNPPLLLYTDEKREYVRALGRARLAAVHHLRISSHKPRTVANPLFAANYLDRQIRKDQANHVRETVCFARNVNNTMSRLAVYFTHHNYLKAYRERERGSSRRTHAEVAGIPAGRIAGELRRVFTSRPFFMRSRLEGFWRDLWLRRLTTPLKDGLESLPKYAYA